MSMKLNAIQPVLIRNYIAGTNTFLRGRPGIGKTHTIEAFVAKMREKVEGFSGHYFYAPTMSPMDIQASAPDAATGLLKLYNNAALPNAYTDPDAKGVAFFGELPNADPTVARLLQKYINGEDMNGVLRKPEGIIVIADGNRLEDKSGVQQQGRAFLSRFEQIEVYNDADDCIAFATKHNWHERVITFMAEQPASIDNYDEVFGTGEGAAKTPARARVSEEGKLGIWANMRSWERISRKEYAADQLGSPVTLAECIGNLGTGVGSAFDTHKKMLGRLASFDQIMAQPDTVAVPEKLSEQYAMAMIVALRVNGQQIGQAKTFGMRLPVEIQAALLRNLAVRMARDKVNLTGDRSYVEWITNPELAKLINGR